MLVRRLPWIAFSVAAPAPLHSSTRVCAPIRKQLTFSPLSFCSTSGLHLPQQSEKTEHETDNRRSQPLKPGLYLVGTPIGNLEDITLRALRVLNSADVILSEDTRRSGKLLHHYNIKTPLMSYHKFNESQREQVVLRRLKEGEIVALISDAGTPGISDPGMELAKLCVNENVPIIPIPGPCALVSAFSASGLSTDEFTFVGFLSNHSGSRRKRLMVSAEQTATQIFYVPPHKLVQFLEEGSSIFGDERRCVIAREMTKWHEEIWLKETLALWLDLLPGRHRFWFLNQLLVNLSQGNLGVTAGFVASGLGVTGTISLSDVGFNLNCTFYSRKFWRGTLGDASKVFSIRQPKGELTVLIEGNANTKVEPPSALQLENELRELIESGESLSTAVKLVTDRTSVNRKTIYSLALRKFGKQLKIEDDSSW